MLFDISTLTGSKRMGEHSSDPFAEKKRAAWKDVSKAEARCDFAPNKWRLNSRGVFFFSLWKASIYGRTLSEIKGDLSMPHFFAENIYDFITRFFNFSASSANSGSSVSRAKVNQGSPVSNFDGWNLITPPPRRHVDENFAVRTARILSEMAGIEFVENTARTKNRQRVNAEFELLALPKANNIICFDDIVTTGSTFQAMKRLLDPYSKNIIFVSAINNKL